MNTDARTSLRILVSATVLGTPCIGAVTTDPTCDLVTSFSAAGAPTGGVFTPEQATQWVTQLQAGLQANPEGECADALQDALILSRIQAGQIQEAASVARAALEACADPDRRVLLANNFIGLRTKGEPQPLSEAVRAECREMALLGLVEYPLPAALLADARFEEIATVAPLHHVLASTQPTPALRLQELRSLATLFAEVNAAAAAGDNRQPVLMDQFMVAKEITDELLRGNAGIGAPALLEAVGLAPANPLLTGNAQVLLQNVARDARLSVATRSELIATASPELLPLGLRTVLLHALFMDEHRTFGGAGVPDRAGVLERGRAVWASILEAEANLGADGLAEGVTIQQQWDAVVRGTLAILWRESVRLGENAAESDSYAREYLVRFPDIPPASSMRRYLEGH